MWAGVGVHGNVGLVGGWGLWRWTWENGQAWGIKPNYGELSEGVGGTFGSLTSPVVHVCVVVGGGGVS